MHLIWLRYINCLWRASTEPPVHLPVVLRTAGGGWVLSYLQVQRVQPRHTGLRRDVAAGGYSRRGQRRNKFGPMLLNTRTKRPHWTPRAWSCKWRWRCRRRTPAPRVVLGPILRGFIWKQLNRMLLDLPGCASNSRIFLQIK